MDDSVKIDFDPQKNTMNIDKHGLPFEDVAMLDWTSADVLECKDTLEKYKELRFSAVAKSSADGELYMVIFTVRDQTMRVISFRRASIKERRLYREHDET